MHGGNFLPGFVPKMERMGLLLGINVNAPEILHKALRSLITNFQNKRVLFLPSSSTCS